MNYQDVEAFLTIVRTRSISKSADALYLSQSTISHRLKALEDELNTTLIIRQQGRRSIELTPTGEDFIPIAEKWKSVWTETQQLKNSKDRLFLSIGCVDSYSSYIFPSLYKQLSTLDTPINLTIKTHQTYELYDLLEKQEIDVAFVCHEMQHANILITPIFSEAMVFICSQNYDNYPQILDIKDLDPSKELLLNWSTPYSSWHDYWFDTTIRPHIHLDKVSLIDSFIYDNSYWAIAPFSVASHLKKAGLINIHELKNPPPARVCYKIMNKFNKVNNITSFKLFEQYCDLFVKNLTL